MDEDEELARKRIGTSIGAWRIERLLGIGGMASVFVGRRSDGVVAAVKVLHPYYAEYADVRARLAVVNRAVRRDKAERYPDARTMRRDIAAIRAGR